MKKGWKRFWIASILVGSMGIGLCIAGTVMGATWETVNQYAPLGMRFINDHPSGIDEMDEAVHEVPLDALKQSFDEVSKIEVDADVMELQVLRMDDDGVRVEVENARLKECTKFYKKDSTLIIKMDEKLKMKQSLGMVRIYIPEKCFEEVDIDVDAGSIYIEKICAKSLDISVGAGRLEAFADVEEEVDIRCGAGEMILQIMGDKEDYKYDVECGIGEVRIGNESHSGIGSTSKCGRHAFKEMDIECGVGSIEIDFVNN